MVQVLTSGNIGQLRNQVGLIMLVNSNGASIDSLTTVSGVSGPTSTTLNAIPVWNNTAGNNLNNSNIIYLNNILTIPGVAATQSVYQSGYTLTGNYVANINDTYLFTNQSAAIQINMPITTVGKEYRVLSTVSSAVNTVTLSGVGCTIDGTAKKVISSSTIGAGIIMVSDGSNYWSLNNLI